MSNFTVFLVDDDAIMLKALTFELQGHYGDSITFESYPTGEACLQALHKKPNLIVLDYFLDGEDPEAQDGLVTLRKIRSEMPAANVIMLSGQGRFGVAAQTIAGGAYHYITKGEDAGQELIKMIDDLRK